MGARAEHGFAAQAGGWREYGPLAGARQLADVAMSLRPTALRGSSGRPEHSQVTEIRRLRVWPIRIPVVAERAVARFQSPVTGVTAARHAMARSGPAARPWPHSVVAGGSVTALGRRLVESRNRFVPLAPRTSVALRPWAHRRACSPANRNESGPMADERPASYRSMRSGSATRIALARSPSIRCGRRRPRHRP